MCLQLTLLWTLRRHIFRAPLLAAASLAFPLGWGFCSFPLAPLSSMAWATVLVRKPKGDCEVAFYPFGLRNFISDAVATLICTFFFIACYVQWPHQLAKAQLRRFLFFFLSVLTFNVADKNHGCCVPSPGSPWLEQARAGCWGRQGGCETEGGRVLCRSLSVSAMSHLLLICKWP